VSGLFTRLARQAVGQPRNLVRAAVSMPYQQGPEASPARPGNPVSGLAADSVENNPRHDRDGSLSSSRVAQSPPSAGAKSATIAGAGHTPGCSSGPGSEAIKADRSALPAPSDSIGEPVSQRSSDPILPGVTGTQVLVQHEPADSQFPPSAQSSDGIFTTPGHEPPLVVEAGHHKQPSRQASSPTGPGAPEPLLPSVASSAPTSPATAEQIPSAVSGSPNEVHVHIGRIELTALPLEAAPKPKASEARQPMSLDEYLARRRPN